MSYNSADARTEMLDDIATAVDEVGVALACLTEAYETLDEDGADLLEERMFRPVQLAYGRLRRAHAEFAARWGVPGRDFTPRSPGAHAGDPRVYIERAVQGAGDAEQRLADLQDSLMPVEVGDPELRAGLAETRALLAEVPARGRALLRTVGR